MTDVRHDRLVRELIAEDASLKGRESELQAIVAELLQNDPKEELSPAFMTRLREDLRQQAEIMGSSALRRWSRMLPFLLTSTAAVTALLVFALPIARDSLRRSVEPANPEADTGIPAMDQQQLINPYSTTEQDATTEPDAFRQTGPASDTVAQPDLPPDNARPESGGGSVNEDGTPVPDGAGEGIIDGSMPTDTGNQTTPPNDSTMEMRMMDSKVAGPQVSFAVMLEIPQDLSGTAVLHDPAGDRPINVYTLPSLEEVKGSISLQVQEKLRAQGTVPREIIVGKPVETDRSYVFDSLPGPVTVRVWTFTELAVDDVPWTGEPLVVPLQMPTYE